MVLKVLFGDPMATDVRQLGPASDLAHIRMAGRLSRGLIAKAARDELSSFRPLGEAPRHSRFDLHTWTLLMVVRLPIAEAIISSRNILLGGRSNEHVLACLEEVLTIVDSITVPSTRQIMARCMAEAINQIKSSHFISAGKVLNFIHNLPLNDASDKRWDIDYFSSMELPAFLEDFEETKNARLIALYVCGRIASQYLPDSS